MNALPAISGELATDRSVGAHREVAEAQAAYLLAQRFPRDEARALDAIRVAFQRPALAERASYEYSKAGTLITGPSASAAAAMARAWGNLSSGWRETTRSIGPAGVPYSDIVAWAEDLQTRTRRAIGFVCEHVIDTRDGPRLLRDEREAYELCANQAARRVRACILALLPEDVVELAMEQAAATVKAKADTSPEGIAKMVDAFGELGVTRTMIERRLQRPLASISAAQVLGLRRVFASLRDGIAVVRDFFEADAAPPADASVDPQTGEISAGPPTARGRRQSRSAPPPPALAGADAMAPTAEQMLEEVAKTGDVPTLESLLDLTRQLAEADRAPVVQAIRERLAALAEKTAPNARRQTGPGQGD
jgi:hypothetical protein